MFNRYFVVEERNAHELTDFFYMMGIEYKCAHLENGYVLFGAKLNIIDRVVYRMRFIETKKERWSKLRTI